MRREGFKRGRIRVYSSLFDFPVINPKAKEWHTHITYENRPLAHPTGVRGSPEAPYALCPKRTNFSYETGKCGRPRCGCCHECWPGKSRGKGKGARKRRARGDACFHDPDWVVPVGKRGGVEGRGDASEDRDDVSEDGDDASKDAGARFHDPDWVVPVRKRGGAGERGDVGEDGDDVSEDGDAQFYFAPVRTGAALGGGAGVSDDVSGDQDDVSKDEDCISENGDTNVVTCGIEVREEEWSSARRRELEGSGAGFLGAMLAEEIGSGKDDWEFVFGEDAKSDAGSAKESGGFVGQASVW